MNRILYSLFLCMFWLFSLSAEIVQCQRLRELLPLIDQDTLVVFNINNVLTISLQDAGSTPWAEEQIARIMREQETDKPHATNLFIPLWHDVLIASDVTLVDPDGEAFIRYLQDKGVKVMALTNRYTEMGYPTHKNLRSVGIDFAKNPPYPEDTWIATKSPAKYIEGVIFNGLINFKGDTLAAFLQQIHYTPKKLIYVEDKPKHLAQVGERIAALGIAFVGVQYGVLESQRESYEPDVAALQLHYHQDLLDDAAAQRLRYNRSGVLPSQPTVAGGKIETQTTDNTFKTIRSFTELKGDLFPKTLLVTELDQVLWDTKGSIGKRAFLSYYVNKLQQLGDTPQAAKIKAERLFEKIQRRAQVYLLDDQVPAFLAGLPKHHCWTVALSYRPESLAWRTVEQAHSVGLDFNSPLSFDPHYAPRGFVFSTAENSQFVLLEKKIATSAQRPAQIVAVSASAEDLTQLKAMAERLRIPFQGRLFAPFQSTQGWPDEDVLALELDYLDHMITNQDAALLLKEE